MRKNLPVTNKEFEYPSDWMLLSITDVKSTIKYANNSFCEASGYSLAEMKGQPHNMVRHPDMPSALFDNMWKTIRQGHPWKGIVKNRCANGDHYWVDAFVTPITFDGKITEYQSVRVKPLKAQVDRADEIYKKINASPDKDPKPVQISFQIQLIIVALLSLVPSLILSITLGGFAWVCLLISMFFLFVGGFYVFIPFKHLALKAKKIYDNDLMTYLYTGRQDDIAKIDLALQMRSSEVKALLGRALDSCIQSKKNAEASKNKSHELKTNRKKINEEVQQVAHSIDGITHDLNVISQNCAEAAKKALEVHDDSYRGEKIVEETLVSIDSMSSHFTDISNTINELDKYSKGIGSVLDVIQGIAEQTNLLALNAAIEAARAGEQGRGFAVVADEVRALAKRTHDSTSEIKVIIDLIQKGSEKAVHDMSEKVELVNQCVNRSSKAGKSLGEINQAVNTITEMTKQIAKTVERQSKMAFEVNESLATVSKIMDSNDDLEHETHKLHKEVLDKIGSQKLLVAQLLQYSYKKD